MLLIRTKSRAFLLGAIAAALISQPVLAQFSDSYNFLKAVDERDGAEAEKYLNEPGSVIVNTKRDQTGETALHIVVGLAVLGLAVIRLALRWRRGAPPYGMNWAGCCKPPGTSSPPSPPTRR